MACQCFFAAPLAFTLFFTAVIVCAAQSLEPHTPPPNNRGTLLFVAELCRHGDRSPLLVDGAPPGRWPDGPGQLTAIGMRAHYELGTRLRARYVNNLAFLRGAYSHEELYVRSTDIDRTLMSAQSQLAGLYPPGSGVSSGAVFGGSDREGDREETGIPPYGFQPIPVHTTPVQHDMMLLPGANCPRHDYLVAKARAGAEYQRKIDDNVPFFRHVEQNLSTFGTATAANMSTTDRTTLMKNMVRVWDSWVCDLAHGYALPRGVTPDDLAKATDLANWQVEFSNRGTEARRLRAGLTLNAVREHFGAAARRAEVGSGAAKKFLLLSAHDTTVAATLAAMGVFDGKYPPYNSTVMWELWQRETNSSKSSAKEYFVHVEFNGVEQTLPGCPTDGGANGCPLEQYLAATRDVTIYGGEQQREAECRTGARRYLGKLSSLLFGRGAGADGGDGSASAESAATMSGGGGSGNDNGTMDRQWERTLVLAVVLSIALAAGTTLRLRYNGYVKAPTADLMDDAVPIGRPAQTDRLANQRILM